MLRRHFLGLCALALGAPAAIATSVAKQPPVRVGSLVIEMPWMRQPPDGARVAGGYVRITNSGTAPDRLISAASPLAGRMELHEMSMTGGVMKMREVTGGIVIAPGATVELTPGGLHFMFMELNARPPLGQGLKATLVFEKAGAAEIDMLVTAPGDRPAPKRHAH